ncbi:RidA family protein [Rubellimicrobium sp. CFH 75288]|uniref:RidA family protein n=1 Tax=Rubellimicrobium sp. CFH 75288 TaxID=2697034 RepID=UPI001412F5AE|nr:RidA family protein [Rubellimicrobium sp. CFH 75288]NAZ35296.1 RidA family protein [Rubellimicrobium sp. CFH 75288]
MSHDIQRIEPGPRMSQAVIHGGVAHLAGQVGAPGASVAEQTRAVLAEIDRLLAACGTSKSRLLTAQIWLADMAAFEEMNAVWDAWIDPANPPARWTGEARLATPDYKVEIIVTAAVG